MSRYAFDEVKEALAAHWGLVLRRGGEMGDDNPHHDGRWAVEYSRTGYLVWGNLPGRGHGFRRYETLGQVVASCQLTDVIARTRAAARAAAALWDGASDAGALHDDEAT